MTDINRLDQPNAGPPPKIGPFAWHAPEEAQRKERPSPSVPKTVRRVCAVEELQPPLKRWRKDTQSVALVPTMGALHGGHLSLVRLAKKRCHRVVVSIFVNPSQFAPQEDFARYPRDDAGDAAKLAELGADLIWAPKVEEMYPEVFATTIEPRGAALGLEGAFRPRHFSGVATVCCKLFGQVRPDIAVFGEKDYQQLCVIRQIVRDLDLNVKIISAPTVRERDGLALSSRNRYLSPEERQLAPALYRTIKDAAASIAAGVRTASVEAKATRKLAQAGFCQVDYVSARDAQSLADYDRGSSMPGRVLAAAWLGRTRLIDNCPVP